MKVAIRNGLFAWPEIDIPFNTPGFPYNDFFCLCRRRFKLVDMVMAPLSSVLVD
jgi:hypothetical protein